ncbi:MAG: hypothetical protein K2X39_08315, partial [Silvanigrellaceae bacterium]|nr:hypothetical protein [Silvanigrellaceae bacterium]
KIKLEERIDHLSKEIKVIEDTFAREVQNDYLKISAQEKSLKEKKELLKKLEEEWLVLEGNIVHLE